MHRRLLIFARAPILGQVKTRLSPVLSAEQTLLLHKQLVLHTLERASESAVDELELWADCRPDHEFFQHCQKLHPGLKVRLQAGDNLGSRMAHALHAVKTGSAQVLIGSDCPAIDAEYLNAAFDSLEQGAQAVIGPALDGGYVLLGSKGGNKVNPLPIFHNIPWGTSEVLQLTIEKLNAAAISYHTLTPLQDIDRPEDLSEAQRFDLPSLPLL